MTRTLGSGGFWDFAFQSGLGWTFGCFWGWLLVGLIGGWVCSVGWVWCVIVWCSCLCLGFPGYFVLLWGVIIRGFGCF